MKHGVTEKLHRDSSALAVLDRAPFLYYDTQMQRIYEVMFAIRRGPRSIDMGALTRKYQKKHGTGTRGGRWNSASISSAVYRLYDVGVLTRTEKPSHTARNTYRYQLLRPDVDIRYSNTLYRALLRRLHAYMGDGQRFSFQTFGRLLEQQLRITVPHKALYGLLAKMQERGYIQASAEFTYVEVVVDTKSLRVQETA